MIQVDHQPTTPTTFYKEYSRLYYDRFNAIRKEQSIQFNHPAEPTHLPTVFIDTMTGHPNLYLLNWKESTTEKTLYLKGAADKQWIKISMNRLPERLAITDGHAFLFGAKELVIVGLNSQGNKSLKLEESKIVDVKLCYTQSKEVGVHVLYFNQKLGYFTKEYSRSSGNSLWGQLCTIIRSLSLKKNEQEEYFQIVLPNLIGISLRDKVLTIYDMNRISPTSLKAPFQPQTAVKSPKIRWAFSESDQDFSQAIHIYILAKNKILEYTLHIARIQSGDADSIGKKVSIQYIARGCIIDWAKSMFEKNEFQITSPDQITDFQVTEEQIMYRQCASSLTQIPLLHKISLKSYHRFPTIISQESALWYQYFRSPQNPSNLLSRFQHQLPEQTKKQSCFGKKPLRPNNDTMHSLNKWRQHNQFRTFFVFNSRIFISRTHSITEFHQISSLQYQLQNYHEADRHRDEELKLGNLLKDSNRFSNMVPSIILQEYKAILKELKGYVELLHNMNTFKEYQHQFILSPTQLFINTLRDKIDYYHEVVIQAQTQIQYKENLYKNTQILRFISYLKRCFFNQEFNYFEYFIRIKENMLRQENQLNYIIFFKKLLKSLIPQTFIISNTSKQSLGSNEYLDSLIDSMLDSSDEDLIYCFQTQLRQFISSIFPRLQDKTQPNLVNNVSFIKAYFLIHPKEEQLLPYCHLLVKNPNYRQIIEALKNSFIFIPNQMEILIKAELSQKKTGLTSHIFKTTAIARMSSSENVQQKYKDIVSQILAQECNLVSKSQKQNQELRQMQFLFDKIFKDDYYLPDQAENQLQRLYRGHLGLEAANKDCAHILEVEQIYLAGFTKILNQHLNRVSQIQSHKMRSLQETLTKIVGQVQRSFSNFRKYFKKLYEFERREVVGGTNLIQVSARINSQQSMMVNCFLQSPVKVQSNYLSSIFVILLKRIINSEHLLRLSAKYEFSLKSDELADEILKDIFSADSINHEQMDILYYVFVKKGEKYLRRVLTKIEKDGSAKILKYFDRMEDKDALYRISEDILEEKSRLGRDTIFS